MFLKNSGWRGPYQLKTVTGQSRRLGTSCGVSVDPGRELMITDVRVLEDPVRSVRNGAWTFRHLIRKLARGRDPSELVRSWLETYTTEQGVNGFVFRTA